jgi:hypothetical protein
MEKILILYSNPEDTDRIRLDLEHRAIDHVLATRHLPPNTVVRRHATTFEDLTAALAEDEFSLFHFSGHGTSQGIYLEGQSRQSGELITAKRLGVLLSRAQPSLKAALFMCCFSADSIPDLSIAAPYLLTVFGSADDNSTIEFVRAFYDRYLEGGSIVKACFFAQQRVDLEVVLSRRAEQASRGKTLFEVFPSGNHFGDSFLVDLSEAEPDIERLDLPRERLLALLTRKIRLHQRIFDFPREKALLPVGHLVGVFSWRSAGDLIQCHRLLKMKTGLEQDACDVWASLTVEYNDEVIQKYRLQTDPASPQNQRALQVALHNYQYSYKRLCDWQKFETVLPKYAPEQYRLTKSIIGANLGMAEQKLCAEDLASVVFHLESALSAKHDLLDALTETFTS